MSSANPNRGLETSIRPMVDAELDEVLLLEQEMFSDPWPRSAFEEYLEEDSWGAIVAEHDCDIIGYATYFVAGEEGHLTNIAVRSDLRRKSVAKQLLACIFTLIEKEQCQFVILEVRPSNFEAVAFYQKHGFRLLYRKPNYYRRPVEDALVMVYYFDDQKN